MAEAALASALGSAGPAPLLRWLTGQPQDGADIEYECTKTEFVSFFLSYLRNQTESILQNNTNALQILQHQSTPEKLLSQRKWHATGNTEETPDVVRNVNALVTNERQRTRESPSKEKSNSSHKKPGKRVKTKLFNDNDCHAVVFHDRNAESNTHLECNETNTIRNQSILISSTPMKNSLTNFPQLPLTSPVTPTLETSKNNSKYSHSDSSKERCDTPRMNSRHSSRMSSSEKSINLGDYITTATRVSSKKKKSLKNTSNESTDTSVKTELDLSNADLFPEIGAKRQSQSSEKRRIKPTNIDAGASSTSKSFAINSFISDSFQQPPVLALEENDAFKQQKFQPKELSKSFDTERSILKQERHKLMEKFNILNVSSGVKICPVTPQMKTVRKDSIEKLQIYIDADIVKVNFKDKLEALAKIYNIFLRNNLVLSISAEIYFLISIVLSKQSTEDYEIIENKLQQEGNNVCDFLLKSLHNCSYLAIKTLWMQKQILEVILDKTSLKLLGENKRVRAFFPDLAKFLLNLYGLKCEGEMWSGRDENSVIILESRFTNGNEVVCFNSETDSLDNFPSVLSFQNFKKQRDMFYEILRWWSECAAQGSALTGLRPRVKSLLALAAAPANHAHLARLLTAHMMADCLSNSHESKLSKLQRRLTGPSPSPASADSQRLPRFTGREEFYRDFLTAAESEAFRAHARDSFACELCTLDAGCLPSLHEPTGSADGQARQEYLSAVKRLRLLAKFLGLLAAAPYRPGAADCSSKTYAPPAAGSAPPKERVLQGDLALRNHSQPPIDLHSMLETSLEQRRLSVTIPWLIQYLAMMDYTSLRIKYYRRLIASLFRIYTAVLRTDDEPENAMKRSTVTFLKLCLGWLFEMPHFPQELFYELSFNVDAVMNGYRTDASVDFLELVDENVLSEVCPYLKEFSVLLLTSHPSYEAKDGGSTFRHITPVTMSLSTVDRAKNKERELQARLEEEFLRGQPSSTRRVLELVADRVTSATVKELAGSVLVPARACCRQRALHIVQAWQARSGEKRAALEERLRAMYAEELARAREAARRCARAAAEARAGAALRALLATGAAAAPLEAVARRASVARVERWLRANWSGVEVLCKDVEAEMQHLLLLGAALQPTVAPAPPPPSHLTLPAHHFRAANVSAADLLMQLKELLCQLMEYSAEEVELPTLLERTRLCCRADNVFITPTSRRAILQLSVELLVVLVSRKPSSMTEALLNKFHMLWDEICPHRRRSELTEDSVHNEDYAFDPRNFSTDERMPTPVSSDEEDAPRPLKIVIATDPLSTAPTIKTECNPNSRLERLDSSKSEDDLLRSDPNTSKSDLSMSKSDLNTSKSDLNTSKSENCQENGEELLDLFTRIMCSRNIMILAESRCDGKAVWEAMAFVLLFLLRNNYLSEDSLTEQCLAVYRQDWPQAVLEPLSSCMRRVSERRGRAGKFTLYLDFLAEFCGDMALDHDSSL